MGIEIEQILHIDENEILALKLASLGEGFSFVDRLVQEWKSGKNRFQAQGEAFWGVFSGEELVGICGLNLDPYENDPKAGRLRHLYVIPVRRREGAGRALVNVALLHARDRFSHVNLRTENPVAAKFYERLGFQAIAGDANCTHKISFQTNASG